MSLPRTDTLGRRRTDDIEFTFSPCVCAFQPKHAVSYLNVLGQEGALAQAKKKSLKIRETSICGYKMMIP